MSRFFIGRPIVAMVIAILTVIVGGITIAILPVAQFPKIAPPEIRMTATYVGADALALEKAVATPIEQQVNGVDNLEYMYSVNATSGSQMTLFTDFELQTDPNMDLILTQSRQQLAAGQLPPEVNSYGVTIKKSTTAPLMLICLYSPHGTSRCDLPGQLCIYQHQRSDRAIIRRRSDPDLWGGPICHEVVGKARSTGQAGHHRHGYRQRHTGAEHRESGRSGGRRAIVREPAIHLCSDRSGPPRIAR